MAEAVAEPLVATLLPFTSFPGLKDTFQPSHGPEFTNQVTGEGADRLTVGPARTPEGSWVSAPERNRVQDVVCVFRSTQTASSGTCYEALRRASHDAHLPEVREGLRCRHHGVL
eukprot:14331596-Alexandrium_andersonii.AAC.1